LTRRVSFFDEQRSTNPAPGNYELDLSCQLVKPKTAQPAVFGKSKANRFGAIDTVSPGPAAYTVQSELMNVLKSLNSPRPMTKKQLLQIKPSSFIPEVLLEDEKNKVNLFCYRKFMPPSIPYGKYGTGYDVGDGKS
jgi:hypothetical protein